MKSLIKALEMMSRLWGVISGSRLVQILDKFFSYIAAREGIHNGVTLVIAFCSLGALLLFCFMIVSISLGN